MRNATCESSSVDPIAITAAAGMKTRLTALDLLANNIANASTPGYKADREFHDLALYDDSPYPVSDIRDRWIDLSPASVSATGNPLDFAISGEGWFVLENGAGTALTRNGAFQVSPTGMLQSRGGRGVLGVDGKPIQVKPGAPIEVSKDGRVSQSGRSIATLRIVDVSRTPGLSKAPDGTLLAPAQLSLPPAVDAQVQQGHLEASNAGSAESAIQLVSVMRQFEMLQRAMSICGEMNRKAAEEVARTGA